MLKKKNHKYSLSAQPKPRAAKKPQSDVALDVSSSGHPQKKIKCPGCGQKRYVRYWDSKKMDYLPEQFGKCDREENCGYFNAPWEWLKENRPQEMEKPKYTPQAKTQSLFHEPKQVDRALVNKTLAFYDENNLVLFLRTVLGTALTERTCADYFIGTGQGGATIYWQIDHLMRVRTGKKIQYNLDGHRDKAAEMKNLFMLHEGYEPCIFGLHLLYTVRDNSKMPIAVVESEKTAAIANVYMPYLAGRRVLWMAASGVYGLTQEKMLPLSGREIILVPDFSFHARAIWGAVPMRKAVDEKGKTVIREDGALVEDYVSVADRFRAIGCSVRFFDAAPERADSSDLADLLLTAAPVVAPLEPAYSELALPIPANNGAQQLTAVPFAHERTKIVQNPARRSEYAKIDTTDENATKVQCADSSAAAYLEQQFNEMSPLKALWEALGGGTVEVVYSDNIPWRTTADMDARLEAKYGVPVQRAAGTKKPPADAAAIAQALRTIR